MTNLNSSAFKFCPGCGENSFVANSEKSFKCEKCGFTFFINSAAATAALIFDNADRLLVVVRKFDPAKGTLDLPGGFVDPGETVEQALRREVKEELNIEVSELVYFGSFSNFYEYAGIVYSTTDMAYQCRIDNIADIKPGDDVETFSFYHREQIKPELFGLDSIRLIITEFLESTS